MAGWNFGNITATPANKAPKKGPKGMPQIKAAPTAPAVPSVGRLVPGGKVPTNPGGGTVPPSGYKFPDGTSPWLPTPTVPGKDPGTDLSWQDSGYTTALANLLAQKGQGDNAIVAAGRRAAEDKAKNLALLTESTGKSKTAATQSANKSGLFYSGALGKNLGDIDTDSNRRAGDVNTAFTRGEEDRAAQEAGLTTQYNAAQQAAAQQAIDRWINGAAATEQASSPTLDALIAALTAKNTTSNARSR